VFYTITKFLLTKNRISEAEQSRAFIRGFQLDLWHRISHRLEIKLPNHDPDNFYPLFEINEAVQHLLHGTSQNSFLQPSVTSAAPPTQQVSPYIKVEDLLTLFEQMAQSFLKVLTLQRLMTNTASSSINTQVMTSLDPLSCAFCGQTGHFIAQCLICADYITNEKCKRNPEGKIVLPNGQFTPCSIPGRFIKGRIDEWHKCNPTRTMYEINPVAASSQTSVATNIVSTSSTNVFTADQRIATLEQEIFALRNAKRTFDGVEILKPTCANKPIPAEQPKMPESTTKPMLPLSQPALAEKPTATTQPPLHPFFHQCQGCKGTSVHFLTYPLLSYYPPHLPLSICILPIPLYHLQGPHSKADDFRIQSPMTFQKSTHQMSSTSHALLRSYLSRIGRASDALGQVHVTLQHPLPLHGHPLWEAWY
jgi:hypothetical protein